MKSAEDPTQNPTGSPESKPSPEQKLSRDFEDTPRFKLTLRGDGLALAFLALFFLFWFGELYLGDGTFYGRDYTWSFVPQKAYVARALEQGRIPLWSPELYSGHPILADLSTGALYPLNVLLLLPVSLRGRIDLFFAFHYFLAAVGVFLLLRFWKRSRPASLAGGLAFSLSGYSVSMAWTPFYLMSLAWLPFVILFGTRLLLKPSLRSVAFTALFASLQFLTGEPQGCFFSVMLLLPFFLFQLSKKSFRKTPKKIGLSAGGSLLALLLTVGLVAPQLFPSAELASRSMRKESLTLDQAQKKFFVSPHRLLELPLKQPFGDPSCPDGGFWRPSGLSEDGAGGGRWSMSLYLGIVALFAVAAAMVDRLQRLRVLWLGTCGILALLAAMGPYTPVFHGLFRILPWFRYPAKYMGMVVFCVSLLVGLGADRLIDIPKTIQTRRAVFVGVLLFLLIMALLTAPWLGGLLLPNSAYEATTTIRSAALYALAFVGILTLLGWLSVRGVLTTKKASWAFTALLTLDLSLAHLTLCSTAPRNFFKNKPQLLTKLEAEKKPLEKGKYRFYRVRLQGDAGHPLAHLSPQKATAYRRDSLAPDIGMNWGVQYVEGYLSSSLAVNQRLWEGVIHTGRPLALLRLMAVRYLILPIDATVPPPSSRIKPLLRLPKLGVQILINESALPRAFVVKSSFTLSADDIVRLLTKTGFDPGAQVLFSKANGPPSPKILHQQKTSKTNPSSSNGCHWITNEPERVELSCFLDSPGWVVLSDTFYPGWRSWVNGKEVEIKRAYLQMRAVRAKAGNNKIVFEYRPRSWKIGKAIAIIAIVLLASLFAVPSIASRFKKKKSTFSTHETKP